MECFRNNIPKVSLVGNGLRCFLNLSEKIIFRYKVGMSVSFINEIRESYLIFVYKSMIMNPNFKRMIGVIDTS